MVEALHPESDVIIEQMPDYEIRLYHHMSADHQRIYFALRRWLDRYVLDFLAMNIRYFTSHGKRHSLGVVRQLSNLIKDEMLAEMSSVEILILLCGAWLHDIGLLVNRDENGQELNDDEIRDCHHELSAWKIHEIAPQVGLANLNLAHLLGDICACHRRSIDISDRLPQPDRFIQQETVRTHLLAALLRLADALDTDHHRAPPSFEQIGTLTDDARLHWRICQMIELAYVYDEGRIHLDATCHQGGELTEEDTRDLIRYKFADLHWEFASVREILQMHSFPYTRLTASLVLPKESFEELDETLLDTLEIVPLEIVLYRQKRRQLLKQNQEIFASHWDNMAARLYEKQAQDYEAGTEAYAKALRRAQFFYQEALALVQVEIERQPPERYFLRTLEKYFLLKTIEIDDKLGAGASLSKTECLFLRHMRMVQLALPRASIRTKLQIGIPWEEFDDSHKADFERVIYRDAMNPDYTGGHFRCCSCAAERLLWMTFAQLHEKANVFYEWLVEREADQWRTIGDIKTKQEYHQRSFAYTSRTLRAVTEAGDLVTAERIAEVLVINENQWLDNQETSDLRVISIILRGIAIYLRRQGKNFGCSKFVHLLIKEGWIYKLTQAISAMAGPEKIKFIRGLMLWREIPGNVLYQKSDDIVSTPLQDHIRKLVCWIVQHNIIEDPLWQDTDSTHPKNAGQWTYDTSRKIENLLSFWEYYLLADEPLEDFPRLAGIVQEQEDIQ